MIIWCTPKNGGLNWCMMMGCFADGDSPSDDALLAESSRTIEKMLDGMMKTPLIHSDSVHSLLLGDSSPKIT